MAVSQFQNLKPMVFRDPPCKENKMEPRTRMQVTSKLHMVMTRQRFFPLPSDAVAATDLGDAQAAAQQQ